jgi:hypothetical protein
MTEQQKAPAADAESLLQRASDLCIEIVKRGPYATGNAANLRNDIDRYLLQVRHEAAIRATPQPSPQRDEESTAQEAAPVAWRRRFARDNDGGYETHAFRSTPPGDELHWEALSPPPAASVAPVPDLRALLKAARGWVKSPNVGSAEWHAAEQLGDAIDNALSAASAAPVADAAPPPIARSDAVEPRRVVGAINLTDMADFFRVNALMRSMKDPNELRELFASELEKLASCAIEIPRSDADEAPASGMAFNDEIKKTLRFLEVGWQNGSHVSYEEAWDMLLRAAANDTAKGASDAAPAPQEVSDAMLNRVGKAMFGSEWRDIKPLMKNAVRKGTEAVLAIATKLAHTASTAPPFDTRSPCGDPNVTVAARDAVTGEPTIFVRAKGGGE